MQLPFTSWGQVIMNEPYKLKLKLKPSEVTFLEIQDSVPTDAMLSIIIRIIFSNTHTFIDMLAYSQEQGPVRPSPVWRVKSDPYGIWHIAAASYKMHKYSPLPLSSLSLACSLSPPLMLNDSLHYCSLAHSLSFSFSLSFPLGLPRLQLMMPGTKAAHTHSIPLGQLLLVGNTKLKHR